MAALADGLRHKDAEEYVVPWRTARILGEIGPDASPLVGPLLDLLKDESYPVKSAANEALNRILAR